jgi:glycosyltransferase involved in cell wall biosynthesis
LNNTKILIILSGYSKSGVGEQFLAAMLRNHSTSSIWRFSPIVVSQSNDSGIHPYPVETLLVPYSKYPGLSMMAFRKFRRTNLSNAVERIKATVAEHKIDTVWVFMNSWYTIQIAAELADTRIPYVTHVWDSPEYLAKKSYFPSFVKKKLMSDFSKAMKGAARAVTVSKAMTEIYLRDYGVSSIPMVFCPPKSSWRKFLPKSNDRPIEVIFAGSLYAYAQWNSFLDAVEWNNKNDQKRTINVTCVGNVSRWAKKRKWVNYLSLQPIDKAATMVNNADVAYLPYWMDRSHAHFVKTAFPGKMSFYIASGTPVLFHGPVDSTPTEFINSNKIGQTCHSNLKEEIIQKIEAIFAPDFISSFKINQERTLDEVFHPDRCVEIFNKTLEQVKKIRRL